MIPEVIQETLPYAAAAGGAIVGMALEARAQHNVAANQTSLVEPWGNVADQVPAHRLRKIARVVVGPLVLVGAIAGLANAEAWEPGTAVRDVPPHLEIVVDHSAATGLPASKGEKPVITEIDKIVKLFDNPREVNAEAVVAGSNHFKVMPIAKVSKDGSFGFAPLNDATNNALQRLAIDNASGNTHNPGDALLVITNGNGIGKASNIVSTANGEHVPAFVVNVEGQGASKTTTDSLKKVANGTLAQYWDANGKTLGQVSETVKKTLVPEHQKSSDQRNRLPERILAATLAVGSLFHIYRKRKLMTLGNEIK